MLKRLALPVLLLPSIALAQFWREDLESGQDGWGLVALITLGLAWVDIRDAFRKSKSSGQQHLAAWIALGVSMALFPPLQYIMVLIGLLFLAVVVWRGITGR